jgi:transketolase
MVSASREAADKLAKDGIEMTVVDLHTLRPLDTQALLPLIEEQRKVFVAEEHNMLGGVASIIADTIVDAGLNNVHLVRIGLPSDEYAIIGPPYYLYKHYELDGDGVARRVRKEIK